MGRSRELLNRILEKCDRLLEAKMNERMIKRSSAIDILKTISCAAVVFIHSASTPMDTLPVLSLKWFSSTVWGCLVRFAVPVFLMCSGALLYDPSREIPIKKIYTKYFLRTLTALFVWALVYDWFMTLGAAALGGGFDPNEIWRAVVRVLKFRHHFHLYYLQILLVFYACLPIIRVYVKNADRKTRLYVLAVWFLLGVCLPFFKQFYPLNQVYGIPAQYALPQTWAAMGYGLLGWEMREAGFKRDKLPLFIAMYFLGFAVVFGGTVLFSARIGSLDQRFLEGLSPGVMLMAAGLFGSVSAAAKNESQLAARLVEPTFCIYIVHHFFIMILRTLGFLPAGMPYVFSIPLLVIGTVLCSLVVWKILSRIPIVKDWLI